jgi:hypothetical protein
MWTVQVTLNGSMVIAAGQQQTTVQFSPLQFTFNVDSDGRKPQFVTGSIQGQQIIVTFSASDQSGQGQTTTDGGSGAGATVTGGDLTITRHLEYQYPEQKVLDGPADQPVGTFRIAGEVAVGNVKYSLPPDIHVTPGVTTITVPLILDVPYDPTLLQQQAPVPNSSTTVQGFGLNGTAQVSITQTQKKMVYQHFEDGTDMTNSLNVSKMKSTTRLNANVCYDAYEAVVHGNNHIHVMDDGNDVEQKSSTYRVWRATSLPAPSGGGAAVRWQTIAVPAQPTPVVPPGAQVVDGENTGGTASDATGWSIDTGGAGPSWDDIPGTMIPGTIGSAAWAPARIVIEFLVKVDNMPEFGALYFQVTTYVKKNAYAVVMGDAQVIDVKGAWAGKKSSPAPH